MAEKCIINYYSKKLFDLEKENDKSLTKEIARIGS